MPVLTFDSLLAASRACGLELLGAFPADCAQEALTQSLPRLQQWQERGFAADMLYMKRPPEELTGVFRLLPQAASVLSFAASYHNTESLRPHILPPGCGRVSRYAQGRDYHRELKRRLKRFILEISRPLPPDFPLVHRIFSDAVPLLERVLASAAGAGFAGKNTLFIRPGYGSYLFLAEVLVNLHVDPASIPQAPAAASCGTCSRCLAACPTDALVQANLLDARRCISYLTIEKRGLLAEWERRALGEWLFGCDACQEVCPFNHRAIKGACIERFLPAAGCGPFIDLGELLALRSNEDFTGKYAGTALMRAGREGLLRNACCVAANTSCLSTVGILTDTLMQDSSAVLRRHAAWALAGLRPAAEGLDLLRIDRALSFVGGAPDRE